MLPRLQLVYTVLIERAVHLYVKGEELVMSAWRLHRLTYIDPIVVVPEGRG